MMTDKTKGRIASAALIVALVLGFLGAIPGVAVAAQEASFVDPLLGSVGLEVFASTSITLGGLSDVDPLLGALLLGPEKLEVGWGTAMAQRIVTDADPLLGAVGLEVTAGGPTARGVSDGEPLLGSVGSQIRSGSFVPVGGGTDANPLECSVESQISPGSSITLNVSDMDPLLGAVGLQLRSGSSVAPTEGLLCSNWDLYPIAPV